ncbi:hypothetical protein CONCODRAFT_2356 [Conidiobolus coronatus NRRL 28638]|uniref:Uncharacterized protein n=1 Tax=Conidiobolus coronatus (strain ATCC 28846 / CBS 209.66 / NRRL 28638) TaxID=796925 RepID=A0A137PHT8_CONC2|nr:hypothetical protein CONCODRAFT_2356 [Conidiobolus coronatus NRRL 28638]|eukprot:KXN74550.1 hypothetical protein CONCODRAFT_2356 [Conidiobolus coronatus NRRL 28638]
MSLKIFSSFCVFLWAILFIYLTFHTISNFGNKETIRINTKSPSIVANKPGNRFSRYYSNYTSSTSPGVYFPELIANVKTHHLDQDRIISTFDKKLIPLVKDNINPVKYFDNSDDEEKIKDFSLLSKKVNSYKNYWDIYLDIIQSDTILPHENRTQAFQERLDELVYFIANDPTSSEEIQDAYFSFMLIFSTIEKKLFGWAQVDYPALSQLYTSLSRIVER